MTKCETSQSYSILGFLETHELKMPHSSATFISSKILVASIHNTYERNVQQYFDDLTHQAHHAAAETWCLKEPHSKIQTQT